MIRINLLPPEIIEKRRWDERRGYAVLGLIALAAVLAGVFAVAWGLVYVETTRLNSARQEADSLAVQADSFKVFEERQADLSTRETVVVSALSGRQSWNKTLTELALILPSDAWLSNLTVNEQQMSMTGVAIEDEDGADGHKAAAKLLVRLSDLKQLYDVWLASSSEGVLHGHKVVEFSVNAQVSTPPTATPASAPAPPSQ